MQIKSSEEIKKFAREFVTRVNAFSSKIKIITKKDLPDIICDYMDTETILNFITDRYDYWLDYLDTLSEEELINEGSMLIDMSKEYVFFEKFVNGQTVQLKKELQEGKVGAISKLEIEHVAKGLGKGEIIPNKDDMMKMCDWLRASYYTYEKYYKDKEFLVCLPHNQKKNYVMKEENIAHLLGIDIKGFEPTDIFSQKELEEIKEKGLSYTYKVFEFLTNKDNMEKIIDLQTMKGKPLFDYTKIKVRNYLFQNFGAFLEIVAIAYNVPTVRTGNDECDSFLIKDAKNIVNRDKSFLGFRGTNATTLQAHSGLYHYNNCPIAFPTSVFAKKYEGKGPKIQSMKETRSGVASPYEPICIFSVQSQIELVEKLLDTGDDGARQEVDNPNRYSLLMYHQKLKEGQKKYKTIGKKLVKKLNLYYTLKKGKLKEKDDNVTNRRTH